MAERTLAEVQQWLMQSLAQRADAETVVKTLLASLADCTRADLYARPEKHITESQYAQLEQALLRLNQQEPLAYVLGQQAFWSLDLKVSADTLIPRPDTEVIVETALALELPEHACVLDLGTGTGAIALALAVERPKWHITAVDVSEAALRMARLNRDQNQLTQVQMLQSDWMSSVEGSFDCIISNPPYIAEHDPHLAALTHEPRQALVSGRDGLTDIRQIIAQAQAQLNSRGVLLFEHGYDQHQQVQNLMKQAGFHSITSGKDYGDNWRWTLGYKA